MRPRIFIGSSAEGLKIAQALQVNLDRFAEVSIWTDNIFKISKFNMENLIEILDSSDFGIFVLTPDDVVASRGGEDVAPRDNVIFELGLFAGRLGMEKTYIVQPRSKGLKLPTDLMGITTADYSEHMSGNLVSALHAVATKVELSIIDIISNSEAEKTINEVDLTWGKLCSEISTVGDQIKRSPHHGGFMPDMLIGLSRGGIIVADLLSRYLGGQVPVQCLWADRYKKYPKTTISPPENTINNHFKYLLKDRGLRNILIIDDISRTGSTIFSAKEFIDGLTEHLVIKTLVLSVHENIDKQPDYFAFKHDKNDYTMPFSILG